MLFGDAKDRVEDILRALVNRPVDAVVRVEGMDFRRLGPSGLVVSVVGLGTNNLGMKLDDEQSREVVARRARRRHHAVRHRRLLRRVRGAARRAARGRRDDVVLATKFGSDVRRRGKDNGEDWGARGSRRYVRRAVESSLRRLRTDWIDLYQLHRPDPATPIEETLSALDRPGARGQGALPRAAPTSPAGRSPTPSGPPAPAGSSGSSARRTSTAGSSATSRPTWCRRSSSTASACCPTSRWPAAC